MTTANTNEEAAITSETKGQLFIIHLNNPKHLNSLTIPQFERIAELLIEANNSKETAITLFTSSGEYFSTGANIKTVSQNVDQSAKFYFDTITSRNLYLVSLLCQHKKLLVCALNGPVIGLSASLMLLCDLIYARDPLPLSSPGGLGINSNTTSVNTKNKQKQPFISLPFNNISLTNEGSVSATLIHRIGLSKAMEIIGLSKKLTLTEMEKLGLVNQIFQFENTDKFNDHVIGYLNHELQGLDKGMIFENKMLLRSQFNKLVKNIVLDEGLLGLDRWVGNYPQNAFKEIMSGKRQHKL
ncbi:unnamed protein product [Ambrosiozyma monospora]|uniref:Unnamed protein product n=1 Tax=Ambrosiozyma monospora TaxID=43982 RepID=A0ACB5SVJ8_AMBMO|nr:unnamed protein product [Ambrosiozyma monospora]